jgi:hypothetical protein
MWVLSDETRHVIGDPHVKNHREQESEIQKGVKNTISFQSDPVLHYNVYPENGGGFYK